ncbi:MAG: (2Fe-2S) ferredoxin domain-containing protein [Cyanobacteria bacterium P01_H01_bin.26]
MLDAKQPPYMFTLDGIFLGCLGKKPTKVNSIVLEVEQEQLVIQLPKELRATLGEYNLQPGSRIRCIGRSRVDFEEKVISLKAYHLFPLTAAAPKVVTTTVSQGNTLASTSSKKRGKILVCRKSGCQKRGGRQLTSTLETVLQEYQLHGQVEIQYTGCQKRCSKAPTVTIMPGRYRYDRLSFKDLPTLIKKHFPIPETGRTKPHPHHVDTGH